jgi:hypothetical protein
MRGVMRAGRGPDLVPGESAGGENRRSHGGKLKDGSARDGAGSPVIERRGARFSTAASTGFSVELPADR